MNKLEKILLGFEVGTEEPIYLPIHHTAFTGMTQKAGKTTAEEGAIMRSGLRAITFRTKRGEVGFETTGTEIKPYFLERSDWQYVESLLEATMRENQRFNRSWIIRSCEGTKDLSDVWDNIKAAKEKARGLELSVYTNLDAYFKIVIPKIRKYSFSKTLEIQKEGVSVMNLIGMPTEVQALVIRSVLDSVYENENNIVVDIPEAWKFIGLRQTPVTYTAELLIREGASVKIYLFIDSQDIAGINPKIRGQIDNWILGRQKYEHEIERTLSAIPVRNKPTKQQIQTLKLGHFFAACDIWCKHIYFLPWQISEEIGKDVAAGQKSPEFVKNLLDKRRKENVEVNNEMVWKEKFEELEKKHEELKQLQQRLIEEHEKEKKELEKNLEKAELLLLTSTEELEAITEFKHALAKILPPSATQVVQVPAQTINLEVEELTVNVKHSEKVTELSTGTQQGCIMYVAINDLPKEGFTEKQMSEALQERGWAIPHTSLAPQLSSNLRKSGLIIKIPNTRPIKYRLPTKVKVNVIVSKNS